MHIVICSLEESSMETQEQESNIDMNLCLTYNFLKVGRRGLERNRTKSKRMEPRLIYTVTNK